MGCENADELGCDNIVAEQLSVNPFCLHCSRFTSKRRSQGLRKVTVITFSSQTVKPSNIYKRKPLPILSRLPSHPLLPPYIQFQSSTTESNPYLIDTIATGGRHGPNFER